MYLKYQVYKYIIIDIIDIMVVVKLHVAGQSP
jgi:hypothetical protein